VKEESSFNRSSQRAGGSWKPGNKG